MQKEYKDAMEKISLSDSDKERILANVKKAYEESTDHMVSMDTFARKRPRFSARRMGTVAACGCIGHPQQLFCGAGWKNAGR